MRLPDGRPARFTISEIFDIAFGEMGLLDDAFWTMTGREFWRLRDVRRRISPPHRLAAVATAEITAAWLGKDAPTPKDLYEAWTGTGEQRKPGGANAILAALEEKGRA